MMQRMSKLVGTTIFSSIWRIQVLLFHLVNGAALPRSLYQAILHAMSMTLRGRILMACDLAEGSTRVHDFALHPAAATAEFQRPPHPADM